METSERPVAAWRLYISVSICVTGLERAGVHAFEYVGHWTWASCGFGEVKGWLGCNPVPPHSASTQFSPLVYAGPIHPPPPNPSVPPSPTSPTRPLLAAIQNPNVWRMHRGRTDDLTEPFGPSLGLWSQRWTPSPSPSRLPLSALCGWVCVGDRVTHCWGTGCWHLLATRVFV